ncbi:MAG: SDR family NAD(P)-dependent oxidoreductase [Acidimicrobiales bacterium]
MDLARSSVLVTGGASGLGLATARLMHDKGAEVVILDLATSSGSQIVADLGSRACFAAGDVRSADDVAAAVEACTSRAPLRLAVAAAGVVGTPQRLLNQDGSSASDTIIDVNVKGTLQVLVHAGAAMAAQEPDGEDRGVVVCTASIAAYDGQIGQVAYAASKAAVAGLVLPAAREFGRHRIRVMAIAPGLFETPMLASLPEEARHSATSQIPHPARLGHPSEYAALVDHIIANTMLNGTVVRLDGANRLGPR